MKYFSLNNKDHKSNFENAVVNGIAPDKGLYFPESIPKLSSEFFKKLNDLTVEDLAFEVISPFIGDEIPEKDLRDIISNTLDFDFPVVPVEENIATLELFHGPTLAFKDVGARFMAGCLGYFTKKNKVEDITVLVATSGDTGGAVANGFIGVDGVKVVILYPKGKVSNIQEKQLTTLGQNISALEVDGSFDDCQSMVKKAFLDDGITGKRQLTSANSINVARWLPQMFYYFLAYRQVSASQNKVIFSVPSGNFGNIAAGMMAKKLGLPVHHFVAANNSNNAVEDYIKTGEYQPKKSVATISNAMDIGDPSNFVRILQMFDKEYGMVKDNLSVYSYSDEETRKAIKNVAEETGYVMDPHGAVGYLAVSEYFVENPGGYGIFLETAHPVKFLETVEAEIDAKVEIPDSISSILDKPKKVVEISDYEGLKSYLLS